MSNYKEAVNKFIRHNLNGGISAVELVTVFKRPTLPANFKHNLRGGERIEMESNIRNHAQQVLSKIILGGEQPIQSGGGKNDTKGDRDYFDLLIGQ